MSITPNLRKRIQQFSRLYEDETIRRTMDALHAAIRPGTLGGDLVLVLEAIEEQRDASLGNMRLTPEQQVAFERVATVHFPPGKVIHRARRRKVEAQCREERGKPLRACWVALVEAALWRTFAAPADGAHDPTTEDIGDADYPVMLLPAFPEGITRKHLRLILRREIERDLFAGATLDSSTIKRVTPMSEPPDNAAVEADVNAGDEDRLELLHRIYTDDELRFLIRYMESPNRDAKERLAAEMGMTYGALRKRVSMLMRRARKA